MEKIVSVLTLSSIIGIGCILVGFYYPKNNVFNGLILVGLCILLGLAVKIMDHLIDEIKDRSYKMWIIPLAIFIPASMAYLALTEEPVIGMVIGTAIGLLIAGKLDHPMYLVSVILFVILIFITFALNVINIEPTTFYIIPVAAMGSFLDEFGHDKWKSNKITKFVFKHRFFLKAFAFIGLILGFVHLVHLVGFLCFDIFYDLVDATWQNDIIGEKFMPNGSKGRLNE